MIICINLFYSALVINQSRICNLYSTWNIMFLFQLIRLVALGSKFIFHYNTLTNCF